MEESSVLIFSASISAFIAAFCFASLFSRRIKDRTQATKAQQRALLQGGFTAGILRNGLPFLRSFSRLLLQVKRISRFFKEMSEVIIEKGYFTTSESIGSVFLALSLGIFLILSALGSSFVFGLVGILCFAFIVSTTIKRTQEKYEEDLREAVPDALRSMSVCFHAGLSLHQTFKQVATEVQKPLNALFLRAANELETGKTTTEALGVFKRDSADELSFIAVALDIQHKTGGSLQSVLDTAHDSVQNGLDLKRSLKVQTAQAKLSANIVSIMPFLLIMILSLVSEDFLKPFFESILGFLIFLIAVLMQIGGIMLVRYFLRVQVD